MRAVFPAARFVRDLKRNAVQRRALVKFVLKGLVHGYRLFIRPFLHWASGGKGTCRYDPSCSAYFLEAIDKHGSGKGAWIGIKRILRCHPWGGFGYDPVPPPKASETGESSPNGTPD